MEIRGNAALINSAKCVYDSKSVTYFFLSSTQNKRVRDAPRTLLFYFDCLCFLCL